MASSVLPPTFPSMLTASSNVTLIEFVGALGISPPIIFDISTAETLPVALSKNTVVLLISTFEMFDNPLSSNVISSIILSLDAISPVMFVD